MAGWPRGSAPLSLRPAPGGAESVLNEDSLHRWESENGLVWESKQLDFRLRIPR